MINSSAGYDFSLRCSRSRLCLSGIVIIKFSLSVFLNKVILQYSAKMFKTVYSSVFPVVEKKYPAKVQFILRQQIQPWHPSSTLVHEAATAVLNLAPSKFYEFSAALFDKQKDYFDVNVVNEARNDTYKRLAKLAGGVGIDGEKVYEMLKISDKPGEDGGLNSGNQVTNDVKLMVKVCHQELENAEKYMYGWLNFRLLHRATDGLVCM